MFGEVPFSMHFSLDYMVDSILAQHAHLSPECKAGESGITIVEVSNAGFVN